MSEYESWSLFWYAVTAIATSFYALLVVVAALVAIRQLREAARTRQAELSWAMYLAYTDPAIRAARGTVESLAHQDTCPTTAQEYRLLVADEPPWDHYNSGTPDMHMRRLLRFYNQVGILLRKKLIDENFAYSLVGHGVSSCWPALAPAIEYYQQFYAGDQGTSLADRPRPIYNDVRWLHRHFEAWRSKQQIA